MKLTPLQMVVILVILAGIAYGTYWATVDQMPDITGVVVGNTTSSSNITNNSIGYWRCYKHHSSADCRRKDSY